MAALAMMPMAGGAWILSVMHPAHWAPADGADAATRAAASNLENTVTSQLTRVRPTGKPWTLSVDENQVNAWLSARMRAWAANQNTALQKHGITAADLDRHLGDSMAHFGPGHVELAAEWRGRILSVRYEPLHGDDGAVLRRRGVRVGRLPVPTAWGPETIDLTVPLGDGRRVVVIGATFDRARAMFTCRTEGPQ